MNTCATCSHWAVNAAAVGLGMCTNLDVQLRLIEHHTYLTTQDFGCPFHKEGKCDLNIWNDDDQGKLLNSMLERRFKMIRK